MEAGGQFYDALANSVCRPRSRHKAMPATFAGIQQELRDVIRNQPGYRWAAQHMTAVPWEVAWRKAVPVARSWQYSARHASSECGRSRWAADVVPPRA
jgi:hypothetical protein